MRPAHGDFEPRCCAADRPGLFLAAQQPGPARLVPDQRPAAATDCPPATARPPPPQARPDPSPAPAAASLLACARARLAIGYGGKRASSQRHARHLFAPARGQRPRWLVPELILGSACRQKNKLLQCVPSPIPRRKCPAARPPFQAALLPPGLSAINRRARPRRLSKNVQWPNP